MAAEYPVFVVSSGRSGTALIKHILEDDPFVEAHHEYLCTHVQKVACLWAMGCIDKAQAIDQLSEIYYPAVEYSEKNIFLDSSNKTSWVIDLLIEIFPKARFIHLIRDGRKVVSSYFNKLYDECYDDRSVNILADAVAGKNIYPPPEKKYYWPLRSKRTPSSIAAEKMSQFERICWHWGEVNRVIATSLSKISAEQKQTVRLEDLVSSEPELKEFIHFIGAKYNKELFETIKRPHNVNRPLDVLLAPEEEKTLSIFSKDVMSLYGYDKSKQYEMKYEKSVKNCIETARDYCNNCGEDLSNAVYSAPDTVRGLSVHVCESCGLVQSLPRIETGPKWKASTSSGASWGNIRYGKSFRTNFAINLLERHVSLESFKFVLDIGSNRCSFLHSLRKRNARANLYGIEPDESVIGSCERNENLEILNDRIQNIALPENSYDLIYCSHTLEHLADPRSALEKIHHSLMPDGLLYLEVPNINIINNPNIIEEFFIDKHLYHYSPNTLRYLVSHSGFSPLEFGFDEENIWVLASKVLDDNALEIKPNEQIRMNSLLSNYASNIKANRNEIKLVARKIEDLAKSKEIFIWGGGRILDSLVSYGGFDVSLLQGIIDKNLINYISEIHGKELSPPSVLAGKDKIALIIASRAYYDEISSEATDINPRIDFIKSVFDFF